MRPGAKELFTWVVLSASGALSCSPPPNFLPPPGPDLSRADVLRCSFGEPRSPITVSSVGELAGGYRLFMTGEDTPAELAAGALTLEVASGQAGEMGAAPLLIGMTGIDASVVGAMIPGDASSMDPTAPGIGVYTFEDPSSPGDLTAVARLGAEANRRDRQRFDGAHTTLRITAILPDRFGGTWSSANGAAEAGGQFCAVRAGEAPENPPHATRRGPS
jgi:hypothetical protein